MTAAKITAMTAEVFPALLARMAVAEQSPENMEKLAVLWGGFLGRMFRITYPGSNGSVTKEGKLLAVVEIENHGYGLQFQVPKGKREGSFRRPRVPAREIRGLEPI
jgi:hypothetical protein